MQPYPIVTATTGWFDTASSATTINLQPVYYPAARLLPDPVSIAPPRRSEPMDWLRERVGEYVAAGTLAA